MISFWKWLLLAQIISLKIKKKQNKKTKPCKQNIAGKKNQTNISQKEQIFFSKQQDTGKDTNIVIISFQTTGHFMFTAITILRTDDVYNSTTARSLVGKTVERKSTLSKMIV